MIKIKIKTKKVLPGQNWVLTIPNKTFSMDRYWDWRERMWGVLG